MQRNKKFQGFAKIDQVLLQHLKQKGLDQVFYRHKILQSWPEVAGSFIGPLGEFSRALDLQKGVLRVACLSKDLALKLKLLSQRIIYAINQKIGRQVVFVLLVES